MALVLEQINTEGLAQLSYIIGDDQVGIAAVIMMLNREKNPLA